MKEEKANGEVEKKKKKTLEQSLRPEREFSFLFLNLGHNPGLCTYSLPFP